MSTASTMSAGDAAIAPDEGIVVYGIVAASTDLALEELAGIDGAPLQVITHGPVAAVVSSIVLERPPGRRPELLAYSQTLDALAQQGAVIPLQFGSVVPDEASLTAVVLAPDEEYFLDLLERLEGKTQFNLRASHIEEVVLAEVVEDDPRVAALRERTRELPEDASYGDRVRLGEMVARALERKRGIDADHLLDIIAPHATAHRIHTGSNHVLDVALLVEDDHREAFEAAMEDLAEAVHERMRVRLVGPTAPYDFVGAEPWG